jgi:LytS/YehU family sensor histidine kinase
LISLASKRIILLLILIALPDLLFAQAANEAEAAETIIFFALLPFLLSFSFIFFIFLRRKRESDVRRNMAETEMKALRAQMNPHFIFNSLNSIYFYIQSQKTDEAGQFLLKFSKLMRLVLENSRHKSILLSEDADALKIYMELEALKKPFTFEFKYGNDVDPELLLVPPMIIQPFIENSIIHGFKSKQQDAHISIEVNKMDGELQYVCIDNGEISDETSEAKGKHRSLGTVVTRERLDLLRTSGRKKARFESLDLQGPEGKYLGKKVIVYLPIEEDV